jgi:hypothetical protein
MYHAPTASISIDQIRQRVKGVASPPPPQYKVQIPIFDVGSIWPGIAGIPAGTDEDRIQKWARRRRRAPSTDS